MEEREHNSQQKVETLKNQLETWAVDTTLTVPRLFSTVGATFSAKQRKPMQEKPQQIGRVLPQLKITVRNSEKLRKKPLLQLEIRCSIRLSYGRRQRGNMSPVNWKNPSPNGTTSTSASGIPKALIRY
jgi:hypothetical protein